jgi:hypothetical protein
MLVDGGTATSPRRPGDFAGRPGYWITNNQPWRPQVGRPSSSRAGKNSKRPASIVDELDRRELGRFV